MLYFKKALAPHILAILLISIIMTFLISLVIDIIYEPDIKECQDLNLNLEICQTSANNYRIKANNFGTIDFSLDINKRENLDTLVLIGEQKLITIRETSKKMQVYPIISKNGEEFTCKGKSERIDLNLIKKC